MPHRGACVHTRSHGGVARGRDVDVGVVRPFVFYAVAVLFGVAGGQVLGWVVGAVAAFANITGFVAAILGDDAAFGLVFLVGSLAYAAAVAYGVAWGLGYLVGKDQPGGPEAWGGVLAGILALLLVTVAAEPFVYFIINALPGVAEVIVTSDGLPEFAYAVALHAVTIGALAPILYLPARAMGLGQGGRYEDAT
jgi:hypothetical protein